LNGTESTSQDLAQVIWPELAPVQADRIIHGTPSTATVVMLDTPAHTMGLWKVTPGAFETNHAGYIEFIHVISGTGRLVSEAGVITELKAGTTSLMPEDWKGRWEVDETLTKVFTIIEH